MTKIIGIYQIKNILDNKIYIGQSTNIALRIKQHLSDLKHNRHSNSHLQNAWNKYGEKSFLFEIVEECSKEQLNERESFWINYYGGCDDRRNYNQKEGGKFNTLSQLSIQKIRDKSKGKHYSPNTEFKKGHKVGRRWQKGEPSINRKIVYQYDYDGFFIQHFSCAKEAAKVFHCSPSLINMCAKGKLRYAKGFQWSYIKTNNIGKLHPSHRDKEVYQYTKDGIFIKKYPTIISAANDMNVAYQCISNACKDIIHTVGGYQWRFKYEGNNIGKAKTNKIAIYQYDLNDNFIKKYDSISQAGIENNFDDSNIARCCKGKYKTAYGYKWKFIDDTQRED